MSPCESWHGIVSVGAFGAATFLSPSTSFISVRHSCVYLRALNLPLQPLVCLTHISTYTQICCTRKYAAHANMLHTQICCTRHSHVSMGSHDATAMYRWAHTMPQPCIDGLTRCHSHVSTGSHMCAWRCLVTQHISHHNDQNDAKTEMLLGCVGA